VLGIRYLTGYNYKSLIHKEIIMVITAEIFPELKTSITFHKNIDINILNLYQTFSNGRQPGHHLSL